MDFSQYRPTSSASTSLSLCNAINMRGGRCKKLAASNSHYCSIHSRLNKFDFDLFSTAEWKLKEKCLEEFINVLDALWDEYQGQIIETIKEMFHQAKVSRRRYGNSAAKFCYSNAHGSPETVPESHSKRYNTDMTKLAELSKLFGIIITCITVDTKFHDLCKTTVQQLAVDQGLAQHLAALELDTTKQIGHSMDDS